MSEQQDARGRSPLHEQWSAFIAAHPDLVKKLEGAYDLMVSDIKEQFGDIYLDADNPIVVE